MKTLYLHLDHFTEAINHIHSCQTRTVEIGDPVKSPVGQKPYGQKPQTNKHLNFKTNLFDIYTCNISESLPSDDVSNALQCLYKCFIVIVCLVQIEESIL